MRVSNRNLRRRNRKIWCTARQNREKLAAISCVVHANFSKILRKFDRWMRAFAALHAPATRRRNSATSKCFRSDAGRSFGALRVDRAENLQRFRPYSIGKFTQSRGPGRKEKLTVRNKLAESKQCRVFLNFSLAFPPAKLRNLEKRRARARHFLN